MSRIRVEALKPDEMLNELKIPERIGRLDELANNLWWSWHENARKLFRTLDYSLWRLGGHNPVKELHEMPLEALQAAAEDPIFLQLYDSVIAEFDSAMSAKDTWLNVNHLNALEGPAAYFSMEYAFHNSLPIYAGGLGILAGDICKEANDLGLPMVALGFMYPQGYFHQHISPDGWQQEIYQQLDFDEAPIRRVIAPDGNHALAQVSLGDAMIGIGVWCVKVGRTNVYLLDTNLDENPEESRQLSARLYIADQELRIKQEIVLGIGGVRVLKTLGIKPSVWHANEGHSAFMTLERIRQVVSEGVNFADVLAQVQSTTVFTTHTPVLAGHDVFPEQLVDKYFGGYWDSIGISREKFYELGRFSGSGLSSFNMTALAMRMANYRCAVSELHGKVTRNMWHGLWKELPEEKVPISHVTNGVHMPTWVAPEIQSLYEEYCPHLMGKHDDRTVCQNMLEVPAEKLWSIHQELKRKLGGAIRERMRTRWIDDDVPWRQMLAMGALLDPDVLTIAYARRFVEYKRPALIFHDIERLKRIINNKFRPVQIVFAGKSHPADFGSKCLLQQVYRLATIREFQGRIIFVEDYDMHMARYLVQGVDVWLNTPRRLQEASGTSGMKASMNGVLHLSVLDGWWREGFNGVNGWAIGEYAKLTTPEEEDRADAEALYELLEKVIVPLYYKRDRDGIPHGWTRIVKEAMMTVTPVFCGKRMLKEYIEKMYIPAAKPTLTRKPA